MLCEGMKDQPDIEWKYRQLSKQCILGSEKKSVGVLSLLRFRHFKNASNLIVSIFLNSVIKHTNLPTN